MDYYAIGQRIRKIRKAHELSQEQLAEQIGISTTHMSHIETGNTKLSLPVLVAIANALNVRTDDLLFSQTNKNINGMYQNIYNILTSCSPTQLGVITEVIASTKQALDRYL